VTGIQEQRHRQAGQAVGHGRSETFGGHRRSLYAQAGAGDDVVKRTRQRYIAGVARSWREGKHDTAPHLSVALTSNLIVTEKSILDCMLCLPIEAAIR